MLYGSLADVEKDTNKGMGKWCNALSCLLSKHGVAASLPSPDSQHFS